jgi:hypothetical protein
VHFLCEIIVVVAMEASCDDVVAMEEEDVVAMRRAWIGELSGQEYSELETSNRKLLEALPNVSKVAIQTGSSLNSATVTATLKCGKHWYLQCKKTVQARQHCSTNIPTAVQAMELLIVKLMTEHSECIEYMHQGSSSTGSSTPAKPTVHDRLRMAQVKQQTAERQAEADEAAAEEARTAESTAGYARVAAECKAKASKAAANALKPPSTVSHKKQKKAFEATPGSSVGCASPGVLVVVVVV